MARSNNILLFITLLGFIALFDLSEKWAFQETEKEESFSCPDFGANFKFSNEPKYSVSDDKYLGHWLTHGPNNQLKDFRSGLYSSIAMKRAVLPPLFYSHKNSGSHSRLEIFHVLDVEELSKLISIAEPSQIARKCLKLDESGGTIATGFKQNIPTERIDNLISYYGFENSNLNFFSKNLENDILKKENLNSTSIANRFNYSESCILQEHPWRNIVYDQNLWREIVRATPRPKYIRNAAKWIRDLLFGEDEFAALHWRYNQNDWGRHCGVENEWRSCPIFELGSKNPALFAEKLTKLLSKKNISKLYIAAPPDQSRLVATFKEEILKIRPEFEVLVGLDALKLLQIRFPKCAFIEEHMNNVFSIVEQEICFQSKLFVRADQSTWSSNIREERDALESSLETIALSEVLELELSSTRWNL